MPSCGTAAVARVMGATRRSPRTPAMASARLGRNGMPCTSSPCRPSPAGPGWPFGDAEVNGRLPAPLVLVAEPADRHDAARVRRVVLDLRSEALHVHVERLRVTDVVGTPH